MSLAQLDQRIVLAKETGLRLTLYIRAIVTGDLDPVDQFHGRGLMVDRTEIIRFCGELLRKCSRAGSATARLPATTECNRFRGEEQNRYPDAAEAARLNVKC